LPADPVGFFGHNHALIVPGCRKSRRTTAAAAASDQNISSQFFQLVFLREWWVYLMSGHI
jgi:hypothetical protein